MEETVKKTEEQHCEICLENAAKYRCPQCARQTCSVQCVKIHKAQSQCSGTVDQTAFVRRADFAENEALVQRDYNFLTQLDRTLAVKRQDSRQNKVMKRQRVNNGDGQGVKRGVNVKYLPKGMQRSNQNKSGWDKKRDTFVWSVEFQLMNGNGELLETFHSLRVPEETPLKDAIHLKIKERMGDVPLWCFLRKVDCPASRPVVKKLDMDKVLADELRGETVIEFPTIIVCNEQIIEGYKEGDENSGASDSDGESDSSSDFESSDSDSDSDSEGDSSEDDRPEEESSKREMTSDSTEPFEVLKVELKKDEGAKESTIETNDDAEHIEDIVYNLQTS